MSLGYILSSGITRSHSFLRLFLQCLCKFTSETASHIPSYHKLHTNIAIYLLKLPPGFYWQLQAQHMSNQAHLPLRNYIYPQNSLRLFMSHIHLPVFLPSSLFSLLCLVHTISCKFNLQYFSSLSSQFLTFSPLVSTTPSCIITDQLVSIVEFCHSLI